MTKEKIDAQLALHEMEKTASLKSQFQSLRTSPFRGLVNLGSMIIVMGIIWWFNPEIIEQPTYYILLILILGTGAQIHAEIERINNRIDILHKILKD